MFGFLKRTTPSARKDSVTPRDNAIAAARQALEAGAGYLTRALSEIGIDCAHLAGKGEPSVTPVSSLLDGALSFDDGGRRCELLLGKTPDFQTFDLEPHYRYREIHLLIEDLERLASGNVEAHRRLVRQHAAHALVQSRLLSYFLLRVAIVERLYAADDLKEIEREMMTAVKAILSLTAALPAAFERGLDIAAIGREWNIWPHVTVKPVDSR